MIEQTINARFKSNFSDVNQNPAEYHSLYGPLMAWLEFSNYTAGQKGYFVQKKN